MFSTTTLFKKVICSGGPSCRLPNCIFSHDFQSTDAELHNIGIVDRSDEFEGRRDVKRRKLNNTGDTSVASQVKDAQALSSDVVLTELSLDNKLPTSNRATTTTTQEPNRSKNELQSAKRDVSPPPIQDAKRAKMSQPNSKAPTSDKPITLNPKLLAHDPAGHDKRRQYLIVFFEKLQRLNTLVANSTNADHKQFVLTDNELKLFALNEEEAFARDKPSVYTNLIKQKIATYAKMSLADWLKERRASLQPNEPEKPKIEDPYPPYNSKLTPEEELLILPHLAAHQAPLVHHGYVPIQIPEAEIKKAKDGVAAAEHREVCDLCGSRFQAYPERQPDGTLTTGGRCTHHPVKAFYPQRESANKSKSHRRKIHACCGEPEGTKGCKTHEQHVFVVKQPARLASILPFAETPTTNESDNVDGVLKPSALAFDCEMGYTTNGLELIRLTATEWQSGKELLDVFVQPQGFILDFNSRFSGVRPEDFDNAELYKGVTPPPLSIGDSKNKQLRKAPSPAAARTLLTSLLTPSTPVIGHALDNDLRAVRLIHPTIVDTILLFPHHRGLPARRALRDLASEHLGWKIQTGGRAGASSNSNDGGHDSKEDANAAGELVRVAIEREWRQMSQRGWEMKEGKLIPPPGKEIPKEPTS
ncbi:hypothetical protein EV356DRAFT_502020 [Viridothelium virens]|uniref:Exonuclease domain-containing protein n=1 Tax=Viridothelium virens TaxID=1048519 RepID=A0A6A6HMK3_VIRVR|nr:hypothetical protein EV356DRAFT_502020 [Viridothelium virens]